MPVAPPASTPTVDDEAPTQGGRLLWIAVAVVGTLSAVFAAVVIFANSTAETTKPQDPVAQVRAGDHFVSVGAPDAKTKVVVHEDFGSADSRTFVLASRDFLTIEAAQGKVLVEYHPVALADSDFSSGAWAAWDAVLEQGRPAQALAFHDLLFDVQPSPGDDAQQDFRALARKAGVKDGAVLDSVEGADRSGARATRREAQGAGVTVTPSVRVDGKALTASSPVALADALQRLVLEKTS